MGSIDTAVSAAGASVELSSKKWKELAVPLARLYALQAGIMLLFAAVCAVLFIAVIGGMAAEVLDAPWGIAALAGILVILLLPIGIVMGAVSAVSYNIADSVFRNGRDVPIIESAKRILAPFAVFVVVQFSAVFAILVMAGVLAFLVFTLSPVAGIIGLVIFASLALMAIIIVSFLFQFAPLEIALGGSGGVEAMRKSASLVRNNLASTLVFDIILIGISMAIGTVFSVATQVFSLMFALAAIIPGAFILLVALIIIIYFVQTIVIGVFVIPMKYRFWKAIGGRK